MTRIARDIAADGERCLSECPFLDAVGLAGRGCRAFGRCHGDTRDHGEVRRG